MFKKAIPFILVSGLVLGACGDAGNDVNDNNNNGTGNIPNNNETPMENLDDGRGNNGAGPDMDGIDNGQNGNNGDNGGIINDTNRNDGLMDNGDDMDDILTDDDNKNRNNNENNTNNR